MLKTPYIPVLTLLLAGIAYFLFDHYQKTITVILPDDDNIEYVKRGCTEDNSYGTPCPKDRTPEEVVDDFSDQLNVAFATETGCHGLQLVHFTFNPEDGRRVAVAVSAKWQLRLYLNSRSHTQTGEKWSLYGPKQVYNGSISNVQNLALQVCKIVRGFGGETK